MKDFARSLCQFWSGIRGLDGASLPAYETGRVPDGAALPYITFDVKRPAPLGRAALSAALWIKEENAGKTRALLSDRIAETLPYGGVRLDMEKGFAVLYPGENEFLEWADDQEDREILQCRVKYLADYYSL